MTPRAVVVVAIVLQAIAGLALGLPGHLSVDSVIQLYEARTLDFISYHPPAMSLLLRILDHWVRGTSLFVVLDQVLLTASFALLLAQRRSPLGRPAAVVATLVVLNPLLIAYTGIVWKDVLMAHLAVLGYVGLHVAATRPEGARRSAWVLGAILLLALAASLRQHAFVLAIPGAVYASVLVAREHARRWVLTLGLSAIVVGVNAAIVAYADAVTVGEKFPRTAVGLRSLATFDLVGISANGGVIPDAAIAADAAALVPSYTPLRLGMLTAPKGSPLWGGETLDLLALWARSIANSPMAYLAHRAAHLGDLLWRPCFVMYAGVAPNVYTNAYVPSLGRDLVPELGLEGRWDRRDRALQNVVERLERMALLKPLFWSVVLGAAAVILALRRTATALVILAGSTLAFTLGFGVVGIACDLRYVYILAVAATMLLFALALTSRPAAARKPAADGDRHGSGAR